MMRRLASILRDTWQQPSPGPVVNKKYGKYIPSKYRDYVPEMDESGIKYQKYMQGQSDAMKFQQKVLPEGEYSAGHSAVPRAIEGQRSGFSSSTCVYEG